MMAKRLSEEQERLEQIVDKFDKAVFDTEEVMQNVVDLY